MLTREQILAAKDKRKTELVEVFGDQVMVRECSSKVGHAIRERIRGTENMGEADAAALWIIATVVDPETKEPLFTEENDFEALKELGVQDVKKLCTAALRVNGATREQIEAAAKNS